MKLLRNKMFVGSRRISYNMELPERIKLVTIFNDNKSLYK